MQPVLKSTSTNLRDEIHQALKNAHQDAVNELTLCALTIFRQARKQAAFQTERQTLNQMLLDAIDKLESMNDLYARVLRMRFFDRLPIHRVAAELNLAESTVYLHQRAALDHLTQAILLQEEQSQADLENRLLRRLPLASNVKVVGTEQSLEQLLAVATAPEHPHLISIEGIGGIGKTTLAGLFLRRAVKLKAANEVAWVTAKPSHLSLLGQITSVGNTSVDSSPATSDGLLYNLLCELMPDVVTRGDLSTQQVYDLLHARLKKEPHLIVIDNLETVADLTDLVPKLQALANPSKFVLTTRQSLYGVSNVYHLTVGELDQMFSLELIRNEASQTNLPDLLSASDGELLPIYHTVGGNPLALRLIVGQNHIHPLNTILDGLREARGMTADNLFVFIFRQAWDRLDERCRRVFLSTPLLPQEGDSLEFLADITGTPFEEIHDAMQTLVVLNLVDSRGSLNMRRFSIHGLTRTFLLQQVAKWQ